MALEKHNLQLRDEDIELQEQIANLKEQLFNQQETSKRFQRDACDAAEGQELELSRFKVTVSDGVRESSIKRNQVEDKFASNMNAALKLRKEGLQNCDHLVDLAISELQESEDISKEKIQTPAKQL